MSQQWQQGSAARKPAYEEPSNPYQPVNYAQRLQNAGKNRTSAKSQSFQPGQLYAPPVGSPPPAAAPQTPQPSYMQPPVCDVPELTPGAPYGAHVYQDGPQPFQPAQPPLWTPDEQAWQQAYQPCDQDIEAEVQPAPEAREEPALRDAFTPAAEPKPVQKPKEQTPKRPPVRVGRLLAIAAAVAMMAFCGVAGGRLIAEMMRSERDFEQARSIYREQNGVELQYGAAKVDLLPAGQTYVPTATPEPTPYQPTPTPTPVIPINEAAVAGLSGYAAAGVQAAEVTPAPILRTKLTTYPKNPLRNVHESLAELIAINGDVVGRLVIPGVLDEVVVQRNNTYYLTRTYDGSGSNAGSVFADESCSFLMPPENLLLRGQSSVAGKVFAPLWQYVSGGAEFASAHATATLTTLYEQEQYVLVGVICAQSDPKAAGYFNYASHPTFATDDSMMTYVESVRRSSLYPFGTDVVPSDRLLTLATLATTDQPSVVVLVYRMARDGEAY